MNKMSKRNKTFEMVLTSLFGAVILVMSLIPNIGFITIFPGVSITLVHIPVIIGIFVLNFRSGLILGLFFGIGSFIASFIYGTSFFDLAFRNPLISILPRILFALITYGLIYSLKKLSLVKHSKYIIFGLVSVITIVSLYFGMNAIFKKVIYNDYNNMLEVIERADDDKKDEYIKASLDLLETADQSYKTFQKISVYLTIIISVIVIVLYYTLIIVKGSNYAHVPTIFIIATILHTVLVLGSIGLLKPSLFIDSTGNNQTIIGAIFLVASANGLIEAIFAAIIGTPVAIAISKRLESDDE